MNLRFFIFIAISSSVFADLFPKSKLKVPSDRPESISPNKQNIQDSRIRKVIKFLDYDSDPANIRSVDASNNAGNIKKDVKQMKRRRLYEVYYLNNPEMMISTENDDNFDNTSISHEFPVIYEIIEDFFPFNYTQLHGNVDSSVNEDKNFTVSHWGRWRTWSVCSRTCGGGVRYQTRRCITRTQIGSAENKKSSKTQEASGCLGLHIRYELCNDKDCPLANDFYTQQCSSYDDTPFKGIKYKWEAHIEEDDECKLNCKPINQKYYATLNETVIDGTSCKRPAEFFLKAYKGRAVCVNGICKSKCDGQRKL